MAQRSGWRSEHTLVLAILVLTAAVLGAVILLVTAAAGAGGVAAMLPYAIALAAGGAVAAWLINYLGKRAARKRRPEWLETQAWRQGLLDKLEKGQPGIGTRPGAPPMQESKDDPGSRTGAA